MENQNPKHILIVEDSADLQSLLSQLLSAEGYKTSSAYNGREALDSLASLAEKPALILLDIMMPVMDGVEFRHEQEKDPALAAIPVIVMTADSNVQVKAQNLRVDDFIRKPVLDVVGFLDMIKRHVKPPQSI